MGKKLFKVVVVTALAFILGTIKVNAATVLDGISDMLTDGVYVIKSIPPRNWQEASKIVAEPFGSERPGYYINVIDNCNATFTLCTVEKYGEDSYDMTIRYDYDAKIKAKIDTYVSALEANGKKHFLVSDLELINYWLNSNDSTSLISFSEDFKSNFAYKNLVPRLDLRGGGGDPTFSGSEIGFAYLMFADTFYYVADGFGAYNQNIIYVPTGTTNDKILETIQNRINTYAGSGKVTVAKVKTIQEFIDNYLLDAQTSDEETGETNYYDYAVSSLDDDNGELHFLKNANIAPDYYSANIGSGESARTYYFVVIKDSSKMITPKYHTSDLTSDIDILTDSTLIPLDAIIKANKLTSGSQYNKIISLIKNTNKEIFDLSLFQKSTNSFITTILADGTFEVRIPVSDKFKGKNLMVYYVDEENENEIIPIPVTPDGNYAVFHTNHFSTYTLGEIEGNPQTFDNIMISIVLGVISLVGIIGISIYLKKSKKLN